MPPRISVEYLNRLTRFINAARQAPRAPQPGRHSLRTLASAPFRDGLPAGFANTAETLAKRVLDLVRDKELDPILVADLALERLDAAEIKISELGQRLSELETNLKAATEELAQRPTIAAATELQTQVTDLRKELQRKIATLGKLEKQLTDLRTELKQSQTANIDATQQAEKAAEALQIAEAFNIDLATESKTRIDQAQQKAAAESKRADNLQQINQQWSDYDVRLQEILRNAGFEGQSTSDALTAALRAVTASGRSAAIWQATVQRLHQELRYASRVELFGVTCDKGSFAGPGFALVTDKGRIREGNEDSAGYARLSEDVEAFVVADGMGGHAAGELASRLIIQHLLNALQAGETLYNAVVIANERAARQLPGQEAGSTLVVVIVDRKNKLLQIAQVGDSRAKLVQENETYHLTLDHNLRYMWIPQNTQEATDLPLTEAALERLEAIDLPPAIKNNSNIVASALGAHNKNRDGSIQVPPHIRIVEISLIDSSVNSKLVLTSDGANDGNVLEHEMTNIARDPNRASLLEVAEGIRDNSFGRSSDNISVVVANLPYTLDLSQVNVVEYDRRNQPAQDPALKQEQSNSFDPRLSRLDPGQRRLAYELMDGIAGGNAQTLRRTLFFASLTFEAIKKMSLSEQLGLLHQDIRPEIAWKVVESLATPEFIKQINPLRETGDGFIRAGADVVMTEYFRRMIVQTLNQPKNSSGLASLAKRYNAGPILAAIANNSQEQANVRAKARAVHDAIKPGFFNKVFGTGKA
ncbi:MAG: protein phosphatase 2C domain-containing protein [Candidatus Margulisiibacteriota bacterium]